MRAPFAIAVAAVLAAAGCASGPPAVLDADYGRLRPDQSAGVDSARTELSRSHEELSAAKTKRAEAVREGKLAEDDRLAARKELERSKRQVEAAEARGRAADAHVEYVEKLSEARGAGEEAAQRRVDLAAAKVELLKLQALEQAKLQPSKAYDDKAFYGRVADAQRRLDDARGRVRELEQEATGAQRRWDDLKRKVPVAVE